MWFLTSSLICYPLRSPGSVSPSPSTFLSPIKTVMPQAWADSARGAQGVWRLIHPNEIANALYRSWLDDPKDVDNKGIPTQGRLHWYIPEELQDEVDAKVNVRGETEKIRELYRQSQWKGIEERFGLGVMGKKIDG